MNVVRLAGNNGEGEVLNFATQSPRASLNFAASGSGSASASSSAPTPTTSTAPTSFSRGSINLDRRSSSNSYSNSNDDDDDDVALMEGGTSTDALIFKSKWPMHPYIYICVYMCGWMDGCVCMYVCMYVCTYVCVCMCMCECTFIYLLFHLNIHLSAAYFSNMRPIVLSCIVTLYHLNICILQTTALKFYSQKKNKK